MIHLFIFHTILWSHKFFICLWIRLTVLRKKCNPGHHSKDKPAKLHCSIVAEKCLFLFLVYDFNIKVVFHYHKVPGKRWKSSKRHPSPRFFALHYQKVRRYRPRSSLFAKTGFLVLYNWNSCERSANVFPLLGIYLRSLKSVSILRGHTENLVIPWYRIH